MKPVRFKLRSTHGLMFRQNYKPAEVVEKIAFREMVSTENNERRFDVVVDE